MHTSVFSTCRIHHNGDYSGDILITNEDSTSKAICPQTTIGYSTSMMFRRCRDIFKCKNIFGEDAWKGMVVTLKGTPQGKGRKAKIEVLAKDVIDYVNVVLVDRIQAKLDRSYDDRETLVKLAQVLKIPTDK
jgi:hypothetical protein